MKKDTRFQPGVSGNPNGRPKGSKSKKASIADRLAVELLKTGADGPGGESITYADAITNVLIKAAVNGKRWAIELVLNYIDGRPVSMNEINLNIESGENQTLLEALQEAKRKRESKENESG